MARQRRGEASGELDVVVEGGGEQPLRRPEPLLPWWAAAAAGGALQAAVMWVLVCGAFALGWIAAPDLEPGTVILAGTRTWLLTYFTGAQLGDVMITLTPLGLTLLSVLIGAGLASYATTQARLAAPEELTGRERRAMALRVMGVFTAAHVLAVLVPSFLVATGEEPARALVGAAGVGLVASSLGAIRGTQWRVTEDWPGWARPIPAAVGVGVGIMQLAGLLVLGVGVTQGSAQIMELHRDLDPGTLGGILLVVLQALWVPNLIVWCSSWALGAGFQVGAGSVVTPVTTEVGLIPAIPILGALPAQGEGGQSQLWWLLSGVLAGVACAVVVLRRRPRARFDETALVGGLTGVLAGLACVLLGLLASGGLGTGRLAALGVRPTALFVMAPTLLGLAGVLTGAVWGLLRRPEPAEGLAAGDDGEEPLHIHLEPTETKPSRGAGNTDEEETRQIDRGIHGPAGDR